MRRGGVASVALDSAKSEFDVRRRACGRNVYHSLNAGMLTDKPLDHGHANVATIIYTMRRAPCTRPGQAIAGCCAIGKRHPNAYRVEELLH